MLEIKHQEVILVTLHYRKSEHIQYTIISEGYVRNNDIIVNRKQLEGVSRIYLTQMQYKRTICRNQNKYRTCPCNIRIKKTLLSHDSTVTLCTGMIRVYVGPVRLFGVVWKVIDNSLEGQGNERGVDDQSIQKTKLNKIIKKNSLFITTLD